MLVASPFPISIETRTRYLLFSFNNLSLEMFSDFEPEGLEIPSDGIIGWHNGRSERLSL